MKGFIILNNNLGNVSTDYEVKIHIRITDKNCHIRITHMY